MKRDYDLISFWLKDASLDDIREYIENEPFNRNTDDFLNSLLQKFETEEEFERCSIIKNEIDFRSRLYNDLYKD